MKPLLAQIEDLKQSVIEQNKTESPINNNVLFGRLLKYCIDNTNLVSYSHDSIGSLPTSNVKIVIKTNDLQTWSIVFDYHLKLIKVRNSIDNQHTSNSLRVISALLDFANNIFKN